MEISLTELELTLSINEENLRKATVERFFEYGSFPTESRDSIDVITSMAPAFDGFQDRYRRLFYRGKLYHEKARKIGVFTDKLNKGAKKANAALWDWQRENKTLREKWGALWGQATLKPTEDRIRMIKEIYSFHIYTAAHLALISHNTDFKELVANSNLRVVPFDADKTFTKKGPDVLPRLLASQVLQLNNYPLEDLRNECRIDFQYTFFLKDAPQYQI